MVWVIGIILSYLLGSLPCGLLVGRLRGVDVRKVGSGNVGATNVFRAVGKGWGLSTLAMDILKGYLPAHFLPLAFQDHLHTEPYLYGLVFGCAAIAGHNWSLFLRFHGGKGVATSAGVLIAVAPAAFLFGLGAWLLFLLSTGYVAVASMGAALTIAVASWFLYRQDTLLIPSVLTVLGILVIFTHRSNILRLKNGTEHRFQIWKRKTEPRTNANERE